MLSIPENTTAQEDYDYYSGMMDGYTDASVIAQPLHTNGHTYSRYCEIKAKYEEAIFNLAPSGYQRGYGDGFDKKAVELGYESEVEDEEVRDRMMDWML